MPELPEWKYQTIIKPIIEYPLVNVALHGRILTCVGDEIIEDGYVGIYNIYKINKIYLKINKFKQLLFINVEYRKLFNTYYY